MSTFLSRKYFRNPAWVGWREKVLGVCLCLLIGGLVAGFAVHASMNHDYLFELSESALQGTEVSRADFLAGELLPDVSLPGWKASGPSRAMSMASVPEAFADLAPAIKAYACIALYHRSFETSDAPERKLAVLIFDASTPQQAFGLWHTCRPVGAEMMTAGRGAWQAADRTRAAFWSGRYYTEVRSHKPLTDERMLSRFVQSVAANQLAYGGPFPAQARLSDEASLLESFRYLHSAAFGVRALGKVYAVDRADGVTVWMVDAGSPAMAQKLFARIEKEAADDASSHAAALRRRGAVTLWERANDFLAFCTAGRFVQGAWGDDAELALSVASQKREAALASSDAAVRTSSPVVADASSVFPEVGLDGWSSPRRVDRFTPATLFEKIDGRADAYLQFNVVALNFGTYYQPANSASTVDVYDYDMGRPASASGIFTAESSGGSVSVDIGQAGYVVDGAVFFHKGGRYIQVLPGDPGDADVARAIALAIADTIEDEEVDLWAEKVLPAEGRVADSLTYLAKDVFDLDFLTDVYTAEYERDGRKMTLFVHRAESPEAATELLKKYEASFVDYGEVLWKSKELRMVAGDVGGVVDVVFAKGRYLAGVAGCDDAEVARAAADAFRDRLTGQAVPEAQ